MQNFDDLNQNQKEALQILEKYIKSGGIDEFISQMDEYIERDRQIKGGASSVSSSDRKEEETLDDLLEEFNKKLDRKHLSPIVQDSLGGGDSHINRFGIELFIEILFKPLDDPLFQPTLNLEELDRRLMEAEEEERPSFNNDFIRIEDMDLIYYSYQANAFKQEYWYEVVKKLKYGIH
jgi:hypothetical protein